MTVESTCHIKISMFESCQVTPIFWTNRYVGLKSNPKDNKYLLGWPTTLSFQVERSIHPSYGAGQMDNP